MDRAENTRIHHRSKGLGHHGHQGQAGERVLRIKVLAANLTI